MFGVERKGYPVVLTPGQPIPPELLRGGYPDVAPAADASALLSKRMQELQAIVEAAQKGPMAAGLSAAGQVFSPLTAQQSAPQQSEPLFQSANGRVSSGKPLLGGNLGKIAGILGDALMGFGGRQPIYTQSLLQQRQFDKELQLAEQKRQQDLQDSITLLQEKAKYKDPTALQQNVEYLNQFHPGLGDHYAQQFAEGPPVAVDVAAPDGSVTRQFLPRSAMGNNIPNGSPFAPGSDQPGPEAIADLRANPALAHDFDAKYGAGLSARILGGK